MPENYPPAPFAATVGNFLDAFYGGRDRKQRQKESAAREQEALDESRLRKAQLANEGYVVQDLTVPDTQDRNFLQGVAHWLSGAQPEHKEALLKVGPSTAETAAAATRDFQQTEEQKKIDAARSLAELTGAIRTSWERDRQTNENARNAASNAARIKAAGISASARGPNTTTGLVHAATGVNQQIMETNRELTAANKVRDTGLSRRASPADSATYNATVGGIPRLIQKRDSLGGVYGGIAARMQGAAGMPSAPGATGDITLPPDTSTGADAEHQAIDENLKAALAGGADPAQAAARANQLHAAVIQKYRPAR